MNTAIFPGSFDPLTIGHINIIERASNIFDKVIIAVLLNSSKKPFIPSKKRVNLISDALKCYNNIEVETFNGLTIEYAKEKNVNILIRSARNVADFEYETQLAHINKKLSENIETLFLIPDVQYSYISSGRVRELYEFNGDYSQFVPKNISNYLKNIKGEV